MFDEALYNHEENRVLLLFFIDFLSCITSLDSSKPIQNRISANHEGLRTPITT